MSYVRTQSEDWLKGGWDLPVDFDAFCSAIGHPVGSPRFALWKALRKFMTLPAWKAAPLELKTEVHAFLGKAAPHPVTLMPMKPLSDQ